jgi:putative salt-induced outer membrane protein YdiY
MASILAVATLHSSAQQIPAPVPPPPPPLWQGGAALGLTLTSGNSHTLLFTGKITAARKWDQNELELGADAAYGEQNSVKNNDRYRAFGQYNRLFTDRVFGYVRLEAMHDGIADIAYRVTFGPGAGYYFIKEENTKLRGELGPAVVTEKKGGIESTYATLRLAERFEQKLSATANLWQSVEFLPQVDRWGNFTVNGEIGLDVAISTKWSLKPYIQDSYVNEPAKGRVHNDLKLVVALGYKF